MFEIRFAAGVVRDLNALRAAERRTIMDRIQRRLRHEPTRPTKHVKQLRKLVPPFEHVQPIWQLRVGDHRVFYDVDAAERVVFVRAVRQKPPHAITEEIL
ncbi:MAG: type II toxin-antitoxin system RelE/ParE family toxin [Acidobacteria bacterium]|nr:type II toxin-antitoxin system RelE/ParE family toxin [Acidobacteriota bacterium]